MQLAHLSPSLNVLLSQHSSFPTSSYISYKLDFIIYLISCSTLLKVTDHFYFMLPFSINGPNALAETWRQNKGVNRFSTRWKVLIKTKWSVRGSNPGLSEQHMSESDAVRRSPTPCSIHPDNHPSYSNANSSTIMFFFPPSYTCIP